MAQPIRISSCIICKNAEKPIALALDSIAWCDEIVVVDSGSTDRTVEVCGEWAAQHPGTVVRVMHQEWLGFNQQRAFAVEQCRNDWVLMLDADEECSEELRKELEGLMAEEGAALAAVGVCEMPRKNHLGKRHVRCWGPDYQTRFIHKGRTTWGKAALPEHRSPGEGFRLKRLRGSLIHNRLTPYTPTDMCDGRRMQEYALLLGGTLHMRGKRASWLNLIWRPWFTFAKYYLFKGGILDGRFGLVIAYKTMIIVMLKYSVLFGKELEEKK